jgi:hypothetical protein
MGIGEKVSFEHKDFNNVCSKVVKDIARTLENVINAVEERGNSNNDGDGGNSCRGQYGANDDNDDEGSMRG